MADRGPELFDERHEPVPQSFWRHYVFSTDHKIIGIQYGLTSLLFLLIGFCLIMLMRWQLAYPGEPLPFIGWLFSDETMPDGVALGYSGLKHSRDLHQRPGRGRARACDGTRQ